MGWVKFTLCLSWDLGSDRTARFGSPLSCIQRKKWTPRRGWFRLGMATPPLRKSLPTAVIGLSSGGVAPDGARDAMESVGTTRRLARKSNFTWEMWGRKD